MIEFWSKAAQVWSIAWRIGLATIAGVMLAILVVWIIGIARASQAAANALGKPTPEERRVKLDEKQKPVIERVEREAEEIRNAPMSRKLEFARRLMRLGKRKQ